MTWRFMPAEDKKALITLKDNEIIDIRIESDYQRGYCDTCDFGSVYIQTINFVTRDCDWVTFEVEDHYGYKFDEAKLMYFLTNNLDKFKEMTRVEFFELIDRLFKENPLDREMYEIARKLQ